MVRKLDLHESATFFHHSPVLGIMALKTQRVLDPFRFVVIAVSGG